MIKKKILVLGATGMAGHVVYHYLNETNKYEMHNVVFRNKLTSDSVVLDITNKDALESFIISDKPDIIINCIGVLIKGSKSGPENAIYINAYFPHLLKKISDKIGAKIIHISTDCVFSGKKGNYNVSDFKDADDIYGRSKALGEIDNEKDLTLRTSIIGPEIKKNGEGLFHWFMNQKGAINGFTTAIWGGITTLELAEAIDYAIEEDLVGLKQLSNGTGISKYELLLLMKEIWNRDVCINPYDSSNIVNKSIENSFPVSYIVPSYKEMLKEQFLWMESHFPLYNKFYL